MTISHVSNGPTKNGINTVQAEAPASVESGNLLLWFVANKYASSAPNTPSGFIQRHQKVGGVGLPPGADNGELKATAFSKVADGTEDAAVQTMGVTGGNVAIAIMQQYQRTAGVEWDMFFSAGKHDDNTVTAWSVVSDDDISLQPGDIVVLFVATNNDQYNSMASRSISAAGITFGSYVETRVPIGATSGDDALIAIGHYPVNAGTATVPVTFNVTQTGSVNAIKPAGVVTFVRLREGAGGGSAPVITDQPDDITVDDGDTATFAVTATGATSYQWKRKVNGIGAGVNVVGGTGATTSSYTTPAVALTGSNHNHGDTYYCDVTNGDGTTKSLEAALSVNDITPPDLSSPTATGGALTATGTVTTNKGEGSLHFLADATAVRDAAYIISNGSVQVVSTSGMKSVNFGALTAGTKYAHYVHVDASGNISNVLHTDPFTVTAPSGVLITDPLRNNGGSLLASVTIPKVTVTRLSDLVQVASLTDQVTSVSGVLTLSGGPFTPGTAYVVLTMSSDGTATGSKTYLAV